MRTCSLGFLWYHLVLSQFFTTLNGFCELTGGALRFPKDLWVSVLALLLLQSQNKLQGKVAQGRSFGISFHLIGLKMHDFHFK